jgi:hypothetical protein
MELIRDFLVKQGDEKSSYDPFTIDAGKSQWVDRVMGT